MQHGCVRSNVLNSRLRHLAIYVQKQAIAVAKAGYLELWWDNILKLAGGVTYT